MFYFGVALFAIYLVFKFVYIYFPIKGRRTCVADEQVYQNSFAILVPAYNEEDVILHCIESLSGLDYPDYKVYIINDGSRDHTMDILNTHLNLIPVTIKNDICLASEKILSVNVSLSRPNFYVIDKMNGGKADALNAGISYCSEEVVVTLDADCMLKSDSISVMNEAFQNKKVVAAGGTVHIIQSLSEMGAQTGLSFRIRNTIRYQVLQYMVAFYMHKFTQAIFGSMIVISGAYGAFRREMLIDVHGYRRTVGEDMDITLKIHKYLKCTGSTAAMRFVPNSICYTECPGGLKGLVKQRIRWQKAFVDCLFEYGFQMFRKFRVGVSVFFLLDGFILGTLTSLIAFLIPLTIILNKGVSAVFIVLISSDFLFGVGESIIAILLAARNEFHFTRNDFFKISCFIPFQLMTYRFLNIFFIIAGTLSYFFHKQHWNVSQRVGNYAYSPVIAAKAEPVTLYHAS